MFLFEAPIRSRQVRAGVVARQYMNGTVCINGQKYIGWSMRDAISLYRKKFPARRIGG